MSLKRSWLITLCLAGFLASQPALAKSPHTAPDAPQQAVSATLLDGVWLGTLHAGDQTLHTRLEIKTDSAGQTQCTLYSLDQGAKPIPCANVKRSGRSLSFDTPLVQGHWDGEASADSKTLVGTWKQSTPRPLNFTRQVAAAASQ